MFLQYIQLQKLPRLLQLCFHTHSHLRPVQTWLVGEVFGLKGQRFGLFPTTWTPVAGSGRLNGDPWLLRMPLRTPFAGSQHAQHVATAHWLDRMEHEWNINR
jgi:hypothetical protein